MSRKYSNLDEVLFATIKPSSRKDGLSKDDASWLGQMDSNHQFRTQFNLHISSYYKYYMCQRISFFLYVDLVVYIPNSSSKVVQVSTLLDEPPWDVSCHRYVK